MCICYLPDSFGKRSDVILWNNWATQVGGNHSLLFVFTLNCSESNYQNILWNSVMTLSSRRIIGSFLDIMLQSHFLFSKLQVLLMVEYQHFHRILKFPGYRWEILAKSFMQTTKSRRVWFDISISNYQGLSIIFSTVGFGTTRNVFS